MMGLGYPGGPVIDKLAKLGDPDRFKFAKPHIPGLDYSFSGIKTSLLYFVRDEMAKDPDFMEKNKEESCEIDRNKGGYHRRRRVCEQRPARQDSFRRPEAWLEYVSS